MDPVTPVHDPVHVPSQPLWTRKVPAPVFLVVIAVGVVAFFALWLPAHRGITEAECDQLWPGHVWYDGRCNVQVGDPNAYYIPDGGP